MRTLSTTRAEVMQVPQYGLAWKAGGVHGAWAGLKESVRDFEVEAVEAWLEEPWVSQLPNQLDVLELGCGDGLASGWYLRKLTATRTVTTYRAIDCSSEALARFRLDDEIARRIGRVQLICGDIQAYEARELFDVVIAHHSWYGVPALLAKRFARLVRQPGGMLIALNSQASVIRTAAVATNVSLTCGEEFAHALAGLGIDHSVMVYERVLDRERCNCVARSALRYFQTLARLGGLSGDRATNAVRNVTLVDGCVYRDLLIRVPGDGHK